MNVRSLLSVAAIISAMALPGAAYAQDEHMISGKAVPADQVAEVQAKCDELRKAETTPPAAAATPAPAVANEGWMEDGSKIDVTKLTVKLCDDGKFTATAM
jgi:hypothetical protein